MSDPWAEVYGASVNSVNDNPEDIPPVPDYIKTPIVWLVLAAVAGVIGGVLAWILGGTSFLSVLAWAVAGPVGFGLLAIFSRVDAVARTKMYIPVAGAKVLYIVAVVIILAGQGVASFQFATWMATR